jgi:peptidoglycan/xylan/chitin deacetylase (PgdA/CDA1 family)
MDIHEILIRDSSIWDLFTLKEEYSEQIRDMYDRFPHYASKNRDVFTPGASRYLVENGFVLEYPDNAPFTVCLTHDVDITYESMISKGITALRDLRNSDTPKFLRTLHSLCSKKLPFCNFHDIMKLEEKYGATSTFFFMAENPGEQDHSYNIADLASELGIIIDGGGEVGLHGGHATYVDADMMKNKKEKLEKLINKPVSGYRNHYLRFKIPDTWECLKRAGFTYDSTLGYADCIGFRNGMCHPFKPFNLRSQSVIDIVEIPLIIMDMTFFGTYMRLTIDQAWDVFLRVIHEIERNHGVLTILWHNSSFLDGWTKLYIKILEYCYQRHAWITNGNSVYNWWRNENFCN